MPKFEVKFHTLIETRVLLEAKNEEQAGFAAEDGEGIVLRIPQQLFVEIKNIKQREPDNGSVSYTHLTLPTSDLV